MASSAVVPRRDPPGYLLWCAHTRGPVADLWEGTTLLSDPRDIGFVLQRTGTLASRMGDVLGEPVLEDANDGWVVGRRAVYAGLRRAIEQVAFAAIVQAFDRLCSEWPDQPVDDGLQRFEQATGLIIGKAAFGPDASAVIPIAAELLNILLALAYEQGSATLQTVLKTQAKHHDRRLQTAIGAIVESRAQCPTASDLASLLIHPEVGGLDVAQATRMLKSVMLAGYGVPALALSWALILLDRHPEEYATVGQEANDSTITAIHVSLPAANAVVQETLRLYPPTWLIGRRLNTEAEIGGRHFPAGHRFYMSSYITGRDGRYFHNPRTFKPSRWSGGQLESQLPRYVYFPFGAGPRTCLGHMFATLEVKVLLAMLVREKFLHVVDPERVRINSRRGLRPMHMTLARS
jgi:cytochrome P450